jgi:alpha-glucosidase (family GH31 glycosyl hydrolase)
MERDQTWRPAVLFAKQKTRRERLLMYWMIFWNLILSPLMVLAAQRDKYASCASQPFCSQQRRQVRALNVSDGPIEAQNVSGYRVFQGSPKIGVTSQGSALSIPLQWTGQDASFHPDLLVELGAVTDSIFSIRVREHSTYHVGGVVSMLKRGHPPAATNTRYSPIDEVIVIHRDAWLPLEQLDAPAVSCAAAAVACWYTTANETVLMTTKKGNISDRMQGTQQPAHRIRIQHQPFRIALYQELEDELNDGKKSTAPVLVWNAADLLAWYASGANTSRQGSIGADIAFPRAVGLYGLPEHALDLRLPETCSKEPLRLYNLDVFEYELGSTLGLYGSVPFVMALNGSRHTVGALWMPTSETYVDLCPLQTSADPKGTLHAHFMSERGLPEMFLLAGPSPAEVSKQLARLSGTAPLPPLFALGYHQSRWNYRDEADTRDVDAQFDTHDIPYDVLWLDIEHTDAKKYFTWDANKFPSPAQLQYALATKANRKLVTIVDPHVKAEAGYELHERALQQQWYIRTPDGQAAYDGWCWPGKSRYPDFMDPRVRQGWSACFTPDFYHGMTEHLHIWVDMNEPSVFNGPEGTLPKNVLHCQGALEHGEIHNLYGHMVHRATFTGLLQGRAEQERPFVLSRSFFTGSQRYGAVWTGDNAAQWSHLAASVPMLLSIGLAGIPFVGADVGGFFGDPSPELLTRWYQAAAYQPFFRGHAHLDTKRREPWLFGEPYTSAIREAIDERYTLLPYWYRLFATEQGVPVMRPLFYEFPDDPNWATAQTSWLVGEALLVAPVIEKGLSEHRIQLPGSNRTCWYPMLPRSMRLFPGLHAVHRGQEVVVYREPSLATTGVFQRGGTIVPRWERRRRSSSVKLNDPLTLHVALDEQWRARGSIYIDDGHSYAFQKGDYCFWQVKASREFQERNSSWLRLEMELQTLDGQVPPSNTSRCASIIIERLVAYTPAGERMVIRKPLLGRPIVAKRWQGAWPFANNATT